MVLLIARKFLKIKILNAVTFIGKAQNFCILIMYVPAGKEYLCFTLCAK